MSMPRKQKNPAPAYDPEIPDVAPERSDMVGIVDEPTVGDLGGIPSEPYLPGFAVMADSPDELVEPMGGPIMPQSSDLENQEHRPGEVSQPVEPTGPVPHTTPIPPPQPTPPPDVPSNPHPDSDDDVAAVNAERKRIYEAQRRRHGIADKPAITPADADFSTPSSVSYTSRIQIIDAWRYPGSLSDAPDWIDRNWAGYGDDDVLRHIPSGPCLRVPSHSSPAEVVLARVGDFVCRQSVALDGGAVEMRTDVWPAEQFMKIWIARPKSSRAAA
jgi:hypothetical protein